ncbi:unknown protein [Desulfotalea psychrophila LSv54]|uniref:Type IV pilus assembly protein PilP n=2 Tax=Desulfotalea psychrophila TaxID=84980 RepID=Q6AS35_DESPS|nr:unknown protein [Desulfotalea psychrophila LSv54]
MSYLKSKKSKHNTMRILSYKKKSPKAKGIYYLLPTGILLAQTCLASIAPSSLETAADSFLKDQASFEYQMENRQDPFLPFIKEQQASTQANMDEIVDSEETLFGMRLFEPDQLKLVAILATPEKKVAMVQDLIGQGFTIETGTLIGKRGVVKDITAKSIIIEETATNRAGKKKITQIIMALKSEGEE